MSKRVFHAGPEGTRVAEEEDPAEATTPAADMAFSTHIISLNAMGLMALGLMGEESEVDREAARHAIDTLAMLEAKTRGNLSHEEERLLKAVLGELRLKFIEHS